MDSNDNYDIKIVREDGKLEGGYTMMGPKPSEMRITVDGQPTTKAPNIFGDMIKDGLRAVSSEEAMKFAAFPNYEKTEDKKSNIETFLNNMVNESLEEFKKKDLPDIIKKARYNNTKTLETIEKLASENTDEPIVKTLEKIEKRIKKIEKRLDKLEKDC